MNEATPRTRPTLDEQIRAILPEGWSYGYLGNLVEHGPLESRRDDRAWYIFAPHPGRAGESKDRIGGFPTDYRERLLPIAQGIAFYARRGPREV